MKSLIKIILHNIFIVPMLMAGAYAETGVLLNQSNLKYLGAFKVPGGLLGCDNYNDCTFSGTGGGGPLAFHKDGNNGNGSLFIGGHDWAQKIAEINIPPLVNSTNIENLNRATALQNFHDITEGNLGNILAGGAHVGSETTVKNGGLMVWGSKLVGTTYIYYPGPTQILSHYTSSLNLSTNGDFSGMYQVGEIGVARTVGGYMCKIPTGHQAAFGGPALTGQAALSVIGTTSAGPSAFVFDPSLLVGATATAIPATSLVYYPADHKPWENIPWNPYFNTTTEIKGIVFPSGSDSILFFGRHGYGEYCYGDQTLNPELDGVGGLCYDPYVSAKGPHMPPYKYQVWAYSSTELLSVKNGLKKPWDARPYAVWNFDLPFNRGDSTIRGIDYDESTKRLYVAQGGGEVRQYDKLPIIHVFEVTLTSAPRPFNLQVKPNL